MSETSGESTEARLDSALERINESTAGLTATYAFMVGFMAASSISARGLSRVIRRNFSDTLTDVKLENVAEVKAAVAGQERTMWEILLSDDIQIVFGGLNGEIGAFCRFLTDEEKKNGKISKIRFLE